MDTQLLEIAHKALSESIERLAKAKDECVYWTAIIANASETVVVPEHEAAPQIEQEPVPRGVVIRRQRQEQRKLNDAALIVFRKVLVNHPGITRIHVLGNSRVKEVVAARNDCIRALHEACQDVSIVSLAKFFSVDHSSIFYHLRKYKQPTDHLSVQ